MKKRNVYVALILICLSCIIHPLLAVDRPMVLGYYPSWNKVTCPYTEIPFEHLTHLCHAFIFPYEDGLLDLSRFVHDPDLINACHENEVKISISVGGWDPARTPRFAVMASDSIARKAFVENLTRFCVDYGYDGADIDWEYPPPDKQEYTTLLFQELYNSFASQNPPLLLSIAAPSTDANNRYDWTIMNRVLDWVGVMTYDYYGSWTAKAGPNSALYGSMSTTDQGWIDRSVKHYMNDKGVLPEKLCIGIPFYGWRFEASTLFGASTGAIQRRYYEIETLTDNGWVRHWDKGTQTPWLSNPEGNRIISYDDEESITKKCSYILNHGLAGTIIWALGHDKIEGNTPLLTVVGNQLETYIQTVDTSGLPTTTELHPNYPNPFNAETHIRFSVEKTLHVNISVFNLQGKRVKTLADGAFSPGIYHVVFQGSGFPSGLYFCSMKAEDSVDTQKMLLMK